MSKRLSVFGKSIFLIAVLTLGFFHAVEVDTATMSLRSSLASVTEGSTFVVSAFVNTQGETINNAEAHINYPKDLLEVVSLNSNSSIFTLWAEGPSFSNSSGMINFNGGIANPGYTGSGGTVLSATFRAKKAGSASVFLSGTAIRANDGLGTDIFSGQGNITVEIVAKPVVQTPVEKPSATSTKSAEPVKSSEPVEAEPVIPTKTSESSETKAPEIVYVSPIISQGEQITAQGVTVYPNTAVSVVLKSMYGSTVNYTVTTGATGRFTFTSEPIANGGTYELYAYIVDETGTKGPYSKTVQIEVKSSPRGTLSTLNIPLLTIIVVSVISLLTLLNIFVLYKFFTLKRRYNRMEEKSGKIFKLLLTRANNQIAVLEKTKRTGSLTPHERTALKELREVMDQLENFENPGSS